MRDEPRAPKTCSKQKEPTRQPAPLLADAATLDGCGYRLAGRLAAACNADLFPEILDADRADHHLIADHVTRRAVHAHGFGEFEVLLEGGAYFRARKIFLKPSDIEAGLLGGGHGARLVRGATAAKQSLVKIKVFLATGVLHAHGDRHL